MSVIVGAYATAPRPIESTAQFDRYVADVLSLPGVAGLEVPYQNPESPWNDIGYLTSTSTSSTHVLTLIPALVSALASSPRLGLASVDDDGRRAALELVRGAHRFVQDVNAKGGGAFTHVELHSSPRRQDASADALRRSLDEIATWDWGPVSLTIEHCDADTGAHEPAKGFLPLDDEIAVARERGLGMVLNWGRSAIEARDAAGAARHVDTAVAAGVLTGVVFSGASPEPSAYGPGWGDWHLPIRAWGTGPVAAEAATSLLTPAEVADCVARATAAPELAFVGVKVAPPSFATVPQRVELLAANLAIVAGAVAQARDA
ncbi:DUF4862 family protein [Jiangella asiatica]|nr:DUF4862 family protein [Jiangella asiatica]